MQKFTYLHLMEITEQEQELKLLISAKKEEKMFSPKQQTIDNILNYSKALSIRKSNYLEFIKTVLN